MEVRWLGRRGYRPVHALQRAAREALLDGRGGPTILLVEHDPVVTLGRRAGEEALRVPRARLREEGVEVVRVERGGLATYHGPGQLVGYPVVAPADHGLTVPRFVALLEQAIIEHAATLGVGAHRREGFPGVWVGRAKLGAVGLHLHRGVSIHGFAYNLTIDPADYRWIVPCGISRDQGRVTSVRALTGRAPEPASAAGAVGAWLAAALS